MTDSTTLDPCPLCGRGTTPEATLEEAREALLLRDIPFEFWIGVGVGLVLAFIAVLVGFAASL